MAEHVDEAIDERKDGLVRGVRVSDEGDLAGDNGIGLEARRDAHGLMEAESEEAGSRQQHEGESHLSDDEAVAEGLGGAASGSAARLGLKAAGGLESGGE